MGKPGYEYLITYQYSIEIYDLTVEFVGRFLPGREYVRTREQMVQAARSCKQNIVEGYMEKSTKSYIKLLGVARASLEELLEDFNDRQTAALERKFLTEGGYTEKLFQKRLAYCI